MPPRDKLVDYQSISSTRMRYFVLTTLASAMQRCPRLRQRNSYFIFRCIEFKLILVDIFCICEQWLLELRLYFDGVSVDIYLACITAGCSLLSAENFKL